MSYRFGVTWRGDTVLAMVPDPGNASQRYSGVDKCQTQTYYAQTDLGPIAGASYGDKEIR